MMTQKFDLKKYQRIQQFLDEHGVKYDLYKGQFTLVADSYNVSVIMPDVKALFRPQVLTVSNGKLYIVP